MTFTITRLVVSILLIALGVFYYMRPEKALTIIYFWKKDYEPTTGKSKSTKYGGIILILLGIYYILVMLEVLPMIRYWEWDWFGD